MKPVEYHISRYSVLEICSWCVIFLCVVVLVGWQFDIVALRSIFPEAPQTTPLTTFMLLALGVALILSGKTISGNLSNQWTWICRGITSIVLLAAAWTGAQYLFNLEPSIELTAYGDLVREQSADYPGRPSPHTTVSCILFSLSVGLSTISNARASKAAMTLGILGFILPWIALFGYVSASSLFYAIPGNPETGMSPITAIGFVLLVIGVLGLWPDDGILKLLKAPTSGGKMVRMLLPFTIILPLALGWIVMQSGFFDSLTGFAITWGSFSLFFAGLTIWVGFIIHDSDTQLQQSEQRYHQLVDTVQDYAILWLDIQGNLQSWNMGAEKIKGYKADEIMGKNIETFYTEEDQKNKVPQQLLEKAKQEGRVASSGWRVRKNGSQFWADVVITALHNEDGKVIGFSKVTRDLTQRKKAQERFKNLLESAPDPTVVVNEKGEIQFTNAQVEKVFGFKHEELIGEKVEILIPARFGEHVEYRKDFFKNPQTRPMGIGKELFARTKDGKEVPVEISLSPLETEEGMVVSAAIRDITERKKNEEAINHLNQELAQKVQTLEASRKELESFSYSISHDLRAPLRAIAGFSNILMEDHHKQLDEDGKHVVKTIVDGAALMGDLIDDVLAFSRISRQEVSCEDIDMAELVKETISELIKSEKRMIKVKMGKLDPAYGDRAMIKRVLINLVGNSLKYTQPKPFPSIEVGQENQEGEVVYYVKDNGVGFDEKYADKMFGVFQRLHTDDEFEGTGVGLAIVQRILYKHGARMQSGKMHGGRIWGKSVLGEGATFYFTIPPKEAAVEEKEKEKKIEEITV